MTADPRARRHALLILALFAAPGCAFEAAGAGVAPEVVVEADAAVEVEVDADAEVEAQGTAEVVVEGAVAAPPSIFDDAEFTCPSGRVLPPPALRSPSLAVFEPYGPVGNATAEDMAGYTALLRESYYGGATDERRAEIEDLLEQVSIVELTPAYMNMIIGLDMADADDVDLVGALNTRWYERQYGYQQVVIDGDPTDLHPKRVEARLLVVDGWCRWWNHTISDPKRVDRYRRRLSEIAYELERLGRDRPVRVRIEGSGEK